MKRLLVNLTEQEIAKLEKLLKKKVYSSRSEAFRHAIELLLEVERLPEMHKIRKKIRTQLITGFRLTEGKIKQALIDCLRKQPGLTISEISTYTKLHRHTVRKYLSELIKSKIVYQKKVGVSRLSFVTVSRKRVEGRLKWLR